MYKIPISIIREYIFCERIPYFLLKLQINPILPLWIEQGNDYEKDQKKHLQRRTLKRFNLDNGQLLYNITLEDDFYNFYGKADILILTEDEIIPVEFKIKSDKKFKNHFYQVCCYGILASRIFNKNFTKGFIIHGKKGKTYPINYTEEDKAKCFDLIKKISKILEEDILPNSSANANKCTQCEFRNFCNDRL